MAKVYVDRSAYKQSTCFDPGKKKFHTEEDADRAADATTTKYAHEMSAYICGNHWHITSSPRRY